MFQKNTPIQHITRFYSIDNVCITILRNKCFISFMSVGTLAPLERKEINRKKPVVREAQAEIKRPENVVTVDKEEEGLEQTVRVQQFISRYCKAHRKPIDFFRLVLHPNDFGKSVENILQVSFLVRDEKVKITKGIFT